MQDLKMKYINIFGRSLIGYKYELDFRNNLKMVQKALRNNHQYGESKDSLLDVILDYSGRIKKSGHEKKYKENAFKKLEILNSIKN